VLTTLLDSVLQKLAPMDGAVIPVAVGGAEAARRFVVPVHDQAVLRVDLLRMTARAEEPAPLVLPRADRREARIDPPRTPREPAAGEHRDVLVVRVEPVEGELDRRKHADEVARRSEPVRVQIGERERVDHLTTARGAFL
jgi:hypothetical protein